MFTFNVLQQRLPALSLQAENEVRPIVTRDTEAAIAPLTADDISVISFRYALCSDAGCVARPGVDNGGP